MSSIDYRERLKQRQRQEYEDKGKTGLGRKAILDFGLRGLGTVSTWTPKLMPEKNVFDIVPFQISQPFYAKLRMFSGRVLGLNPGDIDYKLQVPVHRNVGPNNDIYLCLREAFGGKCIVCEDMFDAYRDGDKTKGQKLKPGWRCFYNIYDYSDPDKGYQLFESSYYTFEATSKNDPQRVNLIDASNLDPTGPIVFYDLFEGRTIVAEFKKKLLGKIEFPEVTSIVFEPRDPYDETIFRQVYPLDAMLIIPDPEEVRIAHLGILDEDASDDAKEEKEASAGTGTSGRTRGRAQTSAPASPGKAAEASPAAGRTRGRAPAPEPEPELGREPLEEENLCPVEGKVFGHDCNSGPECEGKTDNCCSEAVFEACSAEHTRLIALEKEEKAKASAAPAATAGKVGGGRRRGR